MPAPDPRRPGQPGVTPTGDPRLATVARYLDDARAAVVALDVAASVLDRGERVQVSRHALRAVLELDAIEELVTGWAAQQ